MSDKREVAIIILLIGIAVVLWFYLQFLTVNLNVNVYQYENAITQSEQLSRQNQALNLQVLHLESFMYIASEAAKMGLTMPANPIDILH